MKCTYCDRANITTLSKVCLECHIAMEKRMRTKCERCKKYYTLGGLLCAACYEEVEKKRHDFDSIVEKLSSLVPTPEHSIALIAALDTLVNGEQYKGQLSDTVCGFLQTYGVSIVLHRTYKLSVEKMIAVGTENKNNA